MFKKSTVYSLRSLVSKVTLVFFVISAVLLPGLSIWAVSDPTYGLSKDTKSVEATVLESNDLHTVVRFDIGDFSKEAVQINGDTFYKIQLKKEGVILNPGAPELPRISRSVIIPDDAIVSINVLSSEYQDYTDTPVIPSKGNVLRSVDIEKVPYSFGSVYKTDEWYPNKLAETSDPYVLRDYRGVTVKLNAFQYNPIKKTLRVYKSVTVEVLKNSQAQMSIAKQTKFKKKPVKEFQTIYSSRFVNYSNVQAQEVVENDTRASVNEKGEMLIIAYDSFYDAMQPFVEWKKQKGIPVTIVKTSTVSSANNATEIKNYIQNFYNNNKNLCWVLLVGDMAQVSSPIVGSDASDSSYAKVAGTDNYPDILVGRFSAESVADVQTQVERSINYERDPQAGADWYKKAVGIASAEGSGETDIQHMDHIRNDLTGFTYSLVDRDYDPGASATTLATQLNQGRSFINYVGHGSDTYWVTTGFSSSSVSKLTNTGKLPFVFSVACVNGTFHKGTCFAEAWLRSKDAQGKPIGAIGTYMSTINQPWVPPMVAQDEATDLLIAKTKTTFGALCYNGSIKMLDTQGTDGLDTFNHWIVFGDPSLQVRTDIPGDMTLSHAGNINAGATSYTVTVTGVAGAQCALYANGTLYGSAYTGTDGKAAISITKALPENQTVKLTVTAFNKLTKVADVTVNGNGPTSTPTPTNTPTSTPTNTPTPTPTQIPGYIVAGYIKPDFTITDSSLFEGTKVEVVGTTKSALTDSNGYFEITGIQTSSSVYDLKVSKAGYLYRPISNIIVNGNVLLGSQSTPVDIWAGDIVSDNVINMADIMELAKVFNSVSGDGKYIQLCDINRDGAVNMSDVMIIVRHMGKTPDNYPAVVPVISTPTPTNVATSTPTPTATNTPKATPTVTPSGNEYPAWDSNSHTYAVGDKVSYKGINYQCISGHTSNVAWDPESTLQVLWKKV